MPARPLRQPPPSVERELPASSLWADTESTNRHTENPLRLPCRYVVLEANEST